MKKRLIKRTMAMIICLATILSSCKTVNAYSLEDFTEDITIIGTGAYEAYQASVISQMIGRAGSSTPDGAKGIAFEQLFADKLNCENGLFMLKPGKTIKLSESSIDDVADIIISDRSGKNVSLIQCKDAESITGIKKILNQVMKGKYDNTELVGTTECAKKFNELAEKAGCEARMIDSGISTKFSSKIADKKLVIDNFMKGEYGVSLNVYLDSVLKNSTYAALLSGGVSYIDSKLKGLSDADTFGNVVFDSASSASYIGATTTVSDLVMAACTYVSASGVITVGATMLAGIIAGQATVIGLKKLEAEYGIKANLAKIYDDSMTATADLIVDCQDKIEDGMDKTKNKVKDGYNNGKRLSMVWQMKP